jgi:hypothetical protein
MAKDITGFDRQQIERQQIERQHDGNTALFAVNRNGE